MQLQLTFPHTELQGAFPANVKFLFDYLEIDTKFADWINRRINHYNFIENQDYIIKEVFTGRRPRKEYYVTLNMAKELCMVENNEKGRQARRYFIDCEKRLKNLEAEQMQKLAFRQSLGYKSQLKQQKEHYENKIKALQYDLEKKKELSFKRKLSKEELLELRKILTKDYDMLCIKEWEFEFLAEKIALESTRITTWDAVVKKLKQSLDYWQNYEEYEEKWRKILRK
ncbi:antA/AntB antirepressor family protein [Campylobacter jejuni]|uniref:AntA/AntB antirepressor family protein n=1 Tax=Campylobacter jejuni TaxID=197 RepID=A0AAW5EFX7_CAMJU|nr:antA/AntB antirepressor family protein [Campylobacter jejuni]MCE3576294.1 antA/AntB antirepressor family protein [Campylobacter jejuni]MCE4860486.1 antA/AntB antirepressor family protein [Campylobacter jejuni]MCH3834609.1 antA/AntB antirepressor family protein [Campylobacter jejuni]MCH3837931.1 antA/AntB antirepressor family protein [Campylobacter jejuni]MCH3840040.1 antA/AntB antirepressor family protein [Campylobacter jejuni]